MMIFILYNNKKCNLKLINVINYKMLLFFYSTAIYYIALISYNLLKISLIVITIYFKEYFII